MNSHDIILVAVIALSAAMLYRKYANRNKGKAGVYEKPKSGSILSSSAGSDDYEPYSKKEKKE